MTDKELFEELSKRADEYAENQKREFAIEELEKIKEEIKSYEIRRKLEFTPNCRDCVFCTRDTFTDIYRTIDNHISELKGENNE